MAPDRADITRLIEAALAEDIGSGDLTSLATVPESRMAHARLVAKAEGVIAGMEVAARVFETVDPHVAVERALDDGARVQRGDLVLQVRGSARSLLAAERTALNFLGRLSGIATLTGRYVEAISGTKALIVDTRKTTPGWRHLEKAAVRAGGGANHRLGLYDMVLIKENHIRAAGGIVAAVKACREYFRENGVTGVAVEVETTNLSEVEETLAAGCDRIMLDNMLLDEIRAAVRHIRSHVPTPEIEASGSMTLGRVRAVAEAGVDFISVGALTHSAAALDLSLLFSEEP